MTTISTVGATANWLNAAMAKVYGIMGLGLLITTLVAVLTHSLPEFQAIILTSWMKWPIMLAPLGFVLAMSWGYEKFSAQTLYVLFLTFAAINGLSLSSIITVYRTSDIITALFSTIGMFGFMTIWGYFTKRDLSSWGQLLFVGLIALIIAMVVNIFVGGSTMALIISGVAVLLFLALTAYDTQKIRETLWDNSDDASKAIIMGSLTLYLDFLNLFVHLLRILGILGSEKD